MAFYFSKRKLRPKEEDEGGELNIVPYLDILMNLIIFMLLSMTGLATFGILNVNAPNYGGPSAGAGDNQDKPLLLTVAISKNGFYVAATGGVLPGQTEPSAAVAPGEGAPTVAKKGADYDYAGLTEKLKEIKSAFPQETKVIIAGEAETTYETLVGTMDAARETAGNKGIPNLFPDVTLGAF